MRKFFLFPITLVLLSSNIAAQNTPLDSLLLELDNVLANRSTYVELKEVQIGNLKRSIDSSNSVDSQYSINKKIVEEYKTYNCDSAIHYVEKNIDIAIRLNNTKFIDESQIMLANMYAFAGLFAESHKILTSYDPKKLTKDQQLEYYSAYHRFYEALTKYTNDDKYNTIYRKETAAYIDSSLLLTSDNLIKQNMQKAYKNLLGGKHELAINQLNTLIPTLSSDSHEYAIATSCLAYVYMARNENRELQKINLIKAAITDTQLSIKDHSALMNLAILLHADEGFDRAYNYIKIALEDANFYNSRYRNIFISRVFPIIEKTYLSKIEQQTRDLKIYLILVSVLAVGMFLTSLYIYKQIKIVVKTRRNLKTLNEKLDEANLIKEEYIGYFLSQCSVYINRLDEYKQFIYRKIKAGQSNDLLKSVSTPPDTKKDVEELYYNFDSAFLRLYPTFVNEFNALLKKDERYKLKSNELNTELRIFALIRLGITDNKQISSFLRYSIQTIYNYRSKVRGKALNENEGFEEKVKNIAVFTTR